MHCCNTSCMKKQSGLTGNKNDYTNIYFYDQSTLYNMSVCLKHGPLRRLQEIQIYLYHFGLQPHIEYFISFPASDCQILSPIVLMVPAALVVSVVKYLLISVILAPSPPIKLGFSIRYQHVKQVLRVGSLCCWLASLSGVI